MRTTRFLLLAFAFLWLSTAQAQSIEEALFLLPDLQFKQLENGANGARRYEMKVRQPLDHQKPELGYFDQLVVLEHRGFDRPVVMNTNGYMISRRPNEVANLLEANYVNVEHRYFGTSLPDTLDWQYLTLENVTADLHHIRTLLGQIYDDNSWVSTGISKGGQTTIFYRYFYPDDVTVSIPYVAPLNRGIEDPRIYEFLDEVGTEECRADILDFQKRMLKEKKTIMPLLEWYSKGADYSFDYLGSIEKAFEFAILEYPFSFWQWGSDCADIPDAKADLETQVQHFLDVVGLAFYDDRSMTLYAPHYYQASTQMGYYGFETDDFKGLLDELSGNPNASFYPKGSAAQYDNRLNEKVNAWVASEADQMLYIYGELDTWTATGVEITEAVESVKYVLPGKHHGTARIFFMDTAMRTDFIEHLEEWLKLEIEDIFGE